MPLARHDRNAKGAPVADAVSTHMPLARHDLTPEQCAAAGMVSTHMPLARHDRYPQFRCTETAVSTHMPLARHDAAMAEKLIQYTEFLLTCLLRGMTLRADQPIQRD